MKLSAPIYRLKRQAKLLSREEAIPLHEALDRVATKEGFATWSLLAAKLSESSPAEKLYSQLRPADLLLIGARPGQGKTLLSLELAAQAMKVGHHSAFFTLEYNAQDCRKQFQDIGVDLAKFKTRFEFDNSDKINADHIINKLDDAPEGTLAVIDYLQLLDQRRENPALEVQIRALKSFAHQKKLIFVFTAQIDRSFDLSGRSFPTIDDVRLPNPLDLKLFNKTCFLSMGEVAFGSN